MENFYVKPEITEETTLKRALVYAEAETEFQGCTTLVRNSNRNNDNTLS